MYRWGGGAYHGDLYGVIISLKNLFDAWKEFKCGKIKKADVSQFAVDVEEHLFDLHHRLAVEQYSHGQYSAFYVRDPKLRSIHKAKVIDRVLHHAIFRVVEPIFDTSFIFDSYSSRKTKGTYKAGDRFRKFTWKLSQNNTKTVWVLKGDIKKFFDSVDHEILLTLLKKKIKDQKVMDVLINIIRSFSTGEGKGIPLGNLTSQLFSNVYLDKLDQFIKRVLQVKYYIRYADDFAILSTDKTSLEKIIPVIRSFLETELKLSLHPNKVHVLKWHQGVDFLGYIHFPYHSIMRTKTKKRMLRKIKETRKAFQNGLMSKYSLNQVIQSYLGQLKHCRSKKLRKLISKTLL